ncbi:HIT family protein [Borrelia miyamotoi]|uniref:HIT family protein n=1 Tax=Borrelia miyamotoi TaxID=47466 RepID=A0AAQ2X0S2_9SPIR|nr:HIT domain-containing protein [Borrelia miyamotoi]AGT27366.1 HIT family hydrolase [Borrelia miyamotoi LB-2001]AJA58545.1 diadenosine tetraphosphate hydrolase [Borrelia miyamotoi]AOW95622.1 diadenosine tetraphosphate hydrolase [Borrelia miyamotoi]QTL83506.1 HIT family protein [Borrelia miyamotoi]WAZ85199.1 HIT family protein [Borrelia miyamotoi]
MSECIFCKIVKDEVACYKVYEDELVLAFLDINPLNIGHTLVIPKQHSNDALDMSDEFNGQILRVCNKVALSLKKLGSSICRGINIYTAIGSDAGQVIFHTHFHVVPRFQGDNFGFKRGSNIELSGDELMDLSRKISHNI